jgi:P-type Cu2+ transporter
MCRSRWPDPRLVDLALRDLNGGHHAYFDAAVMLTFFLLAGRYLDHRTRAVARSAAQELAALEVPRAILLWTGPRSKRWCRSPTCTPAIWCWSAPARGCRSMASSPGASEVDRSLLTGESLPAFAGPAPWSARAR